MAILSTPQPLPLAPAGAKPHRRGWSRYRSSTFYAFISPWMIGFIVLTLLPLLYALLVSFTNFDGLSGRWKWIGLRNYVELLHDPDTWHSLSVTLLFTLIVVPLTIAGGLGLALLMNRPLRGITLFRALLYIPYVVPVVASAIIWRLILDRNAGALDGILGVLHISAIPWLTDPLVFVGLIVLVLWGMGGTMVISLAGLQGIPQELNEAAAIDGANGWQRFFNITLPSLSPVIFFQLVTTTITSLQTLVQPLLLVESSNYLSTVPRVNQLYVVNVYQQMFYNQRMGYGSALLWVFFLIILVITLIVFRFSQLWVYYETDRDLS